MLLKSHWYSLCVNLSSLLFSSKCHTFREKRYRSSQNKCNAYHTHWRMMYWGKNQQLPLDHFPKWQTLNLIDATADKSLFLRLVEFQSLKQLYDQDYEEKFSDTLQTSSFYYTSTTLSISVLFIAARCCYLVSFAGIYIRMQSSATYL